MPILNKTFHSFNGDCFSLKSPASIAICCSILPSADAADQTWTDGNVNNDWNTTAPNWGGFAWTQNNNAIFGGTGETVTLTEPISAGGLTFNSNGYTITGSTLTLTGEE